MAGSADHATKRNSMDDEDEAATEADQTLARCRSRIVASSAKIRMADSEISFIMSLDRSEIPSDQDDADMLELLTRRYPDRYTPEVLEQRRREHKELVAMFHRDDEDIEAQQADIMSQLGEKGYVKITNEVDQTYIDEINEWTRVQWLRLVSSNEILSRARVTTDEENQEALRNFLRRQAEEAGEKDIDYYPDEDYCIDEDEDVDDNDGDNATIESSDLPPVVTTNETIESSDLPTVVTTNEDEDDGDNDGDDATVESSDLPTVVTTNEDEDSLIHPSIPKL